MGLIDTSILVDYLADNTDAVSWLSNFKNAPYISVVNYTELLFGAHDKTEIRLIDDLLQTFNTIHINESISQTALLLVRTFAKSHSLNIADALIAATALHHHLCLYTLNTKHFTMIPSLVVEKPY